MKRLIIGDWGPEAKMTRTLFAMLAALVLASAIVGCNPATDVSREPSQDEIKAGIDRRLAEIDKLPISQAEKDRMKQQVSGQAPNQADSRKAGL